MVSKHAPLAISWGSLLHIARGQFLHSMYYSVLSLTQFPCPSTLITLS